MSGILAPFDRRAIENAIAAWLTRAVGITVVMANQDGPNPDKPYATYQIAGPYKYGVDETRISETPGTPNGQEVTIASVGQGKLVVTVNTYAIANGDPEIEDARQHMDKAQAALGLDTFRADLIAAGLGMIGDEGARNLDFVNSDAFVSRQQCDFAFSIASNAEEKTGYIATLQGTTKIKNPAGVEIDIPFTAQATE